MKKKIIYTATYTEPDRNAVGGKVTLRFVGNKMQMEFKELDELIRQAKEMKQQFKEKFNKDIEFTIYKHQVETEMCI